MQALFSRQKRQKTEQIIIIESLTMAEIKQTLTKMGEKPFRGEQIYGWLHEKLAVSFGEMSNLSGDLRSRLEDRFALPVLSPFPLRQHC